MKKGSTGQKGPKTLGSESRSANPVGSRPPEIMLVAVLAVLVAIAVAVAHWPALGARALSIDDDGYLTNNALVQHPSWTSARRFLCEVLRPSTAIGYYHPLTMVSLMADYALGGRPDDLRVFHRTNLAMHVIDAVLVVVLVYLLFGRPWIAAAVGLLFGVHPLSVEPVVWIGQRKAILAGFWCLWCLVLYVAYVRRRDRRLFWAAWAACGLALLSKPTSTPLPVLLLVLDYWPLRRLSPRTVIEKIPFFALAALSAAITIASHIANGDQLVAPAQADPAQKPLLLGYKVFHYLVKIFWPTHLSPFYAGPEPASLANPLVLGGLVGVVVLIGLVLWSLRWTRALAAGTAFFLTALLPMLGLAGYSRIFAFDNYLYIPVIGILLLMAWVLEQFAGDPAKVRPAWRPAAVAAGVLAFTALLTLGTRQYLQEWKTTDRHDLYMLRLAPNSPYTNFGYGCALEKKGEYGQAIHYYTRAIDLQPRYADAYNNRGNAHRVTYNYDRAIHDYTRAIELDPSLAGAYNNRGVAYRDNHDYGRAIQDYGRAIEVKPNYAEAYSNRGVAYRETHDYGRAISDYTKAIDLNPYYAAAYNNRGVAYRDTHDYGRAIQDCCRAIELNPSLAEAYCNRGNAYRDAHDYGRAIQDYGRAIELKPDYAEAYYNRGNAYRNTHDYDRAIRDYTRTIELKPDLAEVYNNRGNAYRDAHDYGRAIQDYGRAIGLSPDYAEAYNNRGNAYSDNHDYGRAIHDYTRVIELKPNLAEAYNNRGVAYRNTHDYDRAIQDYGRAIELKPDDAVAYYNRGNAYSDNHDYGRAIQDYGRAIDLKPDFAAAYRSRSFAHFSLGEYKKAWADVQKCKQLGGEVNPDFIRDLTQASSRPN